MHMDGDWLRPDSEKSDVDGTFHFMKDLEYDHERVLTT